MKSKIIYISLSILSFSFLLTVSLLAQEKKIDKKDLPKEILTSFQKSYPRAEIKGASIEKEQDKTYYEIESIDGKQKRDLLYTKNGKVAEIEETLNANEMPDFVKNSITKKYPDGKINKVEKLTKGNKISFEAVVEHNGKKSEVVLDAKGNIQKMEKMKKENEEKEGKRSEKENEENVED
jgi:Putative beta-lactamase-inhibitor-like, PepSY-like